MPCSFTITSNNSIIMVENKNRFFDSINKPLQFILLIWGIHLLHLLTGMEFGKFGIFPRELFGLRGVLFAPMIHSGFQHLISNSAPLFVLSAMIFYFYPRVAAKSMTMIYLLTGLAVWLFARRVFHIGASGVVYGLLAFVFWTGIFRRSLKSIILALVVTVLYSGYFLGILPNQEGISWESHLLGGFVGIFTSYWFKEQIEADEEEEKPAWADEQESIEYFLPRDTFAKTKAEREEENRWL